MEILVFYAVTLNFILLSDLFLSFVSVYWSFLRARGCLERSCKPDNPVLTVLILSWTCPGPNCALLSRPCLSGPCLSGQVEPVYLVPVRLDPVCLDPFCPDSLCLDTACLDPICLDLPGPCLSGPCLSGPCLSGPCLDPVRLDTFCLQLVLG